MRYGQFFVFIFNVFKKIIADNSDYFEYSAEDSDYSFLIYSRK